MFLRAPPKASMQNMWELPKIWKCPIFYKMQNTFFTQGSLGVLELIRNDSVIYSIFKFHHWQHGSTSLVTKIQSWQTAPRIKIHRRAQSPRPVRSSLDGKGDRNVIIFGCSSSFFWAGFAFCLRHLFPPNLDVQLVNPNHNLLKAIIHILSTIPPTLDEPVLRST